MSEPTTVIAAKLGIQLVGLVVSQVLPRLSGARTDKNTVNDLLADIEQELHRITDRLDEDRLATLRGGLSLLAQASSTSAKDQCLANALDRFHTIAVLPSGGRTGRFRNNELRSVAFFGMAATHKLLDDPQDVIATKLLQAVETAPSVSRVLLGDGPTKGLVQELGLPPCSLSKSYWISTQRQSMTVRKRRLAGLYKPAAYLVDLAFHPEGTHIATWGNAEQVFVHNVETGDLVRQLPHYIVSDEDNWIQSVALSPDGRFVISGGGEKVKVWDFATGQEIRDLSLKPEMPQTLHKWWGPPRFDVRGAKISPLGNLLACQYFEDNGEDLFMTLGVYDMANGNYIGKVASVDTGVTQWSRNLEAAGEKGVSPVAFTPDGSMLVYRLGRQLHLWDTTRKTEAGVIENVFKTEEGIWDWTQAAFSPDSHSLVTLEVPIGKKNELKVLDILEGKVRNIARTNSYHIALSPDGLILALSSHKEEDTITFFDLPTLQEVQTLTDSHGASAMAFSPDGSVLASICRGRDTIELWH